MAKQSTSKYTSTEALNRIAWGNELMLPQGDMVGFTYVHRSGVNKDIDENYETVWSVGGTYSNPSSATVMKISSSSSNDTSAGTGARTVKVKGVDSNGDYVTETVTLNGQTAVNTTNSFKAVNELRVLTAGSNNANQGIVYSGTGTVSSGVPANKYNAIPVDYNLSQSCFYRVPDSQTGYITGFFCETTKDKGFNAQICTANSSDVLWVEFELFTDRNKAYHKFNPYLKVDSGYTVEIRAKSDLTSDLEFGAGFSMILIDND